MVWSLSLERRLGEPKIREYAHGFEIYPEWMNGSFPM
jgi:hypothetical protein